jgi:hypothetical protein
MTRSTLTNVLIALLLIFATANLWVLSTAEPNGSVSKTLDTLKVYRNSEQQWVAERSAYEGTLSDLRARISDSSASSKALRGALSRATRQAAYWRSVSTGSASGSTTVETGVSDTTWLHDTVFVQRYPIYRFEQQDAWAKFSVRAGKDSTRIDYSISNAYTFTLTRSGTWLRRSTRAQVTNLNPHTQTTELVAFTVKEPTRWGIGPCIGLGWGTNGIQPLVGIGVHYDLIRW